MGYVNRLRQVYVVVDDIEREVSFYRDVLGLPLQFRDGDRWVQFGAGDVSLALASEEEGMGVRPHTFVPVFEVADVDSMRAHLSSRGFVAGDLRDMARRGVPFAPRNPLGPR